METLTAKENRKQKIKTHFARIKLGGTPQKPYFCIDYYDPADGEYHEGFGSYEFRNVEQWLKEEFEIVNNPPKTTNDEIKPADDEIEFVAEQTIKDSGNRREFSTGAVRDMAEGKGRCDLMPLDVVACEMRDEIINYISKFKATNDYCHLFAVLGEFCRRAYKCGTIEQSAANMYLEVSKHFEDGAKKYGENNWQKGLPVNCYIDSAVRHYLKWLRGDKDEPHDRAFVWNIMCCIWTVKHKENKE